MDWKLIASKSIDPPVSDLQPCKQWYTFATLATKARPAYVRLFWQNQGALVWLFMFFLWSNLLLSLLSLFGKKNVTELLILTWEWKRGQELGSTTFEKTHRVDFSLQSIHTCWMDFDMREHQWTSYIFEETQTSVRNCHKDIQVNSNSWCNVDFHPIKTPRTPCKKWVVFTPMSWDLSCQEVK